MYNCFEAFVSNPLRTGCTMDLKECNTIFLMNFESKNNERQYLMIIRSTHLCSFARLHFATLFVR